MDIDRTTTGEITVSSTVSGDDAFDWATEGNTDVIPTTKLPPSTNNYVSSAALDVTGQELSLTLSITNLSDVTASVTLPAGSGGTGDDAFDWATEGNNDLIPNDKLLGSPVYYSSTTSFSGNTLNITVSGLGNDNLSEGDVLIFRVPNNVPTGNIFISVNSNSLTTVNTQGNVLLTGERLINGAYHTLIRDSNIYRLLEGDTEDWSLIGNTDLIPNSKLDGLLTQIMAGTNITIDDSTAGQITIAASGTGTGDDAFDWATEGNTDLIPRNKVYGEQLYYSANGTFSGNVLDLDITQLGTGEVQSGDVIVFEVPLTIPSGNISIRV